MEGVNNLTYCIIFILNNILHLVLFSLIFIIQYPFSRLVRLIFKDKRSPRSKVYVTTVEPKQREGHDSAPTKPKDTLVFLHGFPDSPALWSSTIRRMTSIGYQCISVSIPGSRGEAVNNLIPANVICDQLEAALDGAIGKDKTFTLIGHDWGAIYSQFYSRKYPSRVHRLALLDVGVFRNIHWLVTMCQRSYQSVLAIIYCIGHPLGTYLLRYSLKALFLTSPYSFRPMEEIHSDMTWQYPGIFKNIYDHYKKKQQNKSSTSPKTSTSTNSVSRFPLLENVPTFFLYGRRKSFYFHDQLFLEEVANSPYGFVDSLPCGHWLTCEKEKEWLSLFGNWLDKSKSAVPKQM